MKIPQISFDVLEDSVCIKVPLATQGKFRCKYRDNFQEYGTSMGPSTTPIPANAYIEWQIGYDCRITDDKKNTTLTNLVFEGSKGEKKHPYELSEITYHLCNLNLITKEQINSLIETIDNMRDFLQDRYPIDTKVEDNVEINEQEFFKSIITLPTFNKLNDSCGIITEITIQKQQRASGVQPMVYVNIPVNDFENSENIIGNTTASVKHGILKIDINKIDVITNIFMCFGMCSSNHHHDVLEILKLIRDNCYHE